MSDLVRVLNASDLVSMSRCYGVGLVVWSFGMDWAALGGLVESFGMGEFVAWSRLRAWFGGVGSAH